MRARDLATAAVLTLALATSPADARSQDYVLGEAEATFPEAFSFVATARELPDGTLLVADPLARELVVVDMDAGTKRVIGREGQGPEEYRQPDAVWPLPGDSTLLVDLGNGRLTVLGPDLAFRSTSPIAMGEPGPGREFILAMPQGVDGRGRVYAQAMGRMGMGAALPDSAAILRLDRGSESADTLGMFKLPERTRQTAGGANNQRVSIQDIPLSPQDAWGVAADGSVALARSGDYHLEWVRPDGSVQRGAPVEYDPVRIRKAEKEEWAADQGRAGGGVSIGVQMMNGAMSMSLSRGGGSGATGESDLDQYEWPDDKPPFYGSRIPVDGARHAWVRRHVRAGAPSLYDVFGPDAEHVGTVQLADGRRVIGFGSEALYAVHFDEFDLVYLERYRLPPL